MNKFISKYPNHRIVLSPGIPGNALLGNPPKAAEYVKFEDGIVNIMDEQTSEKIRNHPAFIRGDIIEAEEGKADQFSENRKDFEPVHNISNMEHGVAKTITPSPKVSFTLEQRKIMKEMINEGIKKGIEEALKSTKKDETENLEEKKQEDKNETKQDEDIKINSIN